MLYSLKYEIPPNSVTCWSQKYQIFREIIKKPLPFWISKDFHLSLVGALFREKGEDICVRESSHLTINAIKKQADLKIPSFYDYQ